MNNDKEKKPLEYTFYPGCSLEATGIGYKKSIEAITEKLGITLIELDDWNCCGATTYMSVKELVSFAISSRNLAMAEQFGRDVVTPCSACYLVLHKTNQYFQEYPELRRKLKTILAAAGLDYKGTLRVRHLFETIMSDVGTEGLNKAQKRDLGGLKIATYYGCQMVRPFGLYEHLELPNEMEKMVNALGGEAIEFPMKVKCCGASLIGSSPDVALVLIKDILDCAKEAGAECIMTPCPLCQFNLDVYQHKVEARFHVKYNLPVLYFTQIIGLTLGIPLKKLGFQHLAVSARRVLERYGLRQSVKAR